MDENCMLGIYNTWCEIIHIKRDYIYSLISLSKSLNKGFFDLNFVVNICCISCQEMQYFIKEF